MAFITYNDDTLVITAIRSATMPAPAEHSEGTYPDDDVGNAVPTAWKVTIDASDPPNITALVPVGLASSALQRGLLDRIGAAYEAAQRANKLYWPDEIGRSSADETARTRSVETSEAISTWLYSLSAASANLVMDRVSGITLSDADKEATVRHMEDLVLPRTDDTRSPKRNRVRFWYDTIRATAANASRASWRSARIASGQIVYSDIHTRSGGRQEADGSFTETFGTFPANFLPEQPS